MDHEIPSAALAPEREKPVDAPEMGGWPLLREIAIAAGLWLVIASVILLAGLIGFCVAEGQPLQNAFDTTVSIFFRGYPIWETHTDAGKFFLALYVILAKILLYFAAGLMPIQIFRKALREAMRKAKGGLTVRGA